MSSACSFIFMQIKVIFMEWFRTWTRFETETQGNLEMAYPVGVQLFSFVNTFFCSNKFAWLLDTWLKTLRDALNLMQVIILYGKASCVVNSDVSIVGAAWPNGLGCWIWNLEVPSLNSPPYCYLDLFSVVSSSTRRPRFVNSQLVSLPPVGILNSFFSIG